MPRERAKEPEIAEAHCWLRGSGWCLAYRWHARGRGRGGTDPADRKIR